MSRYLRPFLTYLALTLTVQAVCWALLWVARSSQGVAAADTLPLVVLVLVGLLFVGGSYALSRTLETPSPDQRAAVLGGVLALNALVAWLVPAPLTFVLAPLVAVIAGELYRVFGRHAAMLAAMSVYIVCTLLANFTFDSFLALPLYGQLSVGTLFFGVTFTQRDRVHRFGRGRAYQMIAVAALANLALSAYLGIPLRFLLAGFLAILIAEAADTEMYQRFIKRRWLTRVATSNAVSIPIDSLTFTAIAFAGTLSLATMGEIVFADILAKTVVGLLAAAHIMRRDTRLATTAPAS
jgi:queuosine precursor transporter